MSEPRTEHLTAEQRAALEAELAELEGPRRKAAVQAIKTAREFGDLSENFEYHAAKNEQGLLEARIRTLRDRLNHAVTVEHQTDEHVGVGSIVGIADEHGDELEVEIDWPRRHLLMRTHTALHALSGVVFRDFGAKVTGGNMEPGVARMDFELDGISVEFGQDVERRLNEELTRGYPTEILYLARQEAMKDPDLIRTKVNLIPEWVEEIRVIDIVGLDRQADGGTHVASTLEVGTVRVVKTESKGKANKRMRIELVDR